MAEYHIGLDTSTVALKSDLSNYASITDLASLSSSVSTNTSNIASLTSQITSLASLTSSHTSQISQLQTDVSNCVTLSQLSAYSPTSAYASVAFTGAYSDLSGRPSYSLSKTTETWTFTLDDDSTVSKTILTDVTLVTS